jgi:hypothetical protein
MVSWYHGILSPARPSVCLVRSVRSFGPPGSQCLSGVRVRADDDLERPR